MQVNLEQMSAFVGRKQWFPVQFNTQLTLGISTGTSSSDMLLQTINVSGKTYIRDIEIGTEISPKETPNVIMGFNSVANSKTDEFWEKERKVTLSNKEETTYTAIDFIGKKQHFDSKLRLFEAMVTEFIPIGPIAIETKRLIDYNEFEGTRLGFRLRTSNNLIKWMSIGGYAAYGFTDTHWKYGGDIKFNISRKNDISAGLAHMKDIVP